MPFVEIGKTVNVVTKEKARVLLLRALRRSGLTREEILDLVDVAFQRRRQRDGGSSISSMRAPEN